MGNGRNFKILGLTTSLLSLCAFAGCAGGSGNLATPIASNIRTATAPTTTETMSTTSSPVLGGNALPLPTAGFGPTPALAQLALPGGPSFTGSSGYFPAANTSFPVLAASLVANGKVDPGVLDPGGLTGTGWIPEPSPTSVTATIVSIVGSGALIQLSIPSLNLVTPLVAPTVQPGGALDYVQFGGWSVTNQPGGDPIRFVQGVFGYETPAASMPTSGTATYSSSTGTNGGTIFAANGNAIATLVGGNVALSVNFATGQISGALQNLVAFESAGDGWTVPWYDIPITASIAAGTNKFSGTTAVGPTSTPLTGYCHGCALPVSASLSGSATGSVNGAFYGPAAQNLGAVWSIGGTNLFALGSFAAAR
jgi:hypothetical protein